MVLQGVNLTLMDGSGRSFAEWLKEGSAAARKLQPRDLGGTLNAWTEQRGQAVAISGQTKAFRNLKKSAPNLWALRCRCV